MRSEKWMLAVGYACLAVTVGWVLARPASPAGQPMEMVTAALGEESQSEARPFVVVLLNPRDCAQRIEALTAWNTLHESGRVRVLGLVSDDPESPGALETIRAGVGTRFPLRSISHARMVAALRGLNYHSTPVALVIDSRRRLRMAVPLFDQNASEAVAAATLQLVSLEPRGNASTPGSR